MYTDTEMLDWLSGQSGVSWQKRDNDDDISFFSIPTQHTTASNLREAISRAMQIQLWGILIGDERKARVELEPGYPTQSYPRLFHT